MIGFWDVFMLFVLAVLCLVLVGTNMSINSQ